MYHYVKFHADGGQACIDGLRRFDNQADADTFAELCRNEPGHYCRNSVSQFSSEKLLDDDGFLTLRDGPLSGNQGFYNRQLSLTHNRPDSERLEYVAAPRLLEKLRFWVRCILWRRQLARKGKT